MNIQGHWLQFGWHDRTVTVTGGAGLLGSHVVARLRARGLSDDQFVIPRSAQYSLPQWAAVKQLFIDTLSCSHAASSRLIVIHLAGSVSGIGYSRGHPGELFCDYIMMGVQRMVAERRTDRV